MSKYLSPVSLTKSAARVSDIPSDDLKAFREFWTEGDIEVMFVPVADFLLWKGIRVKSDDYPKAWPAKDWSFSYRAIAAEVYAKDDSRQVVKKSAGLFLLFDAKFLCENFEKAQLLNVERSQGYRKR